jgi:hypothetical protein
MNVGCPLLKRIAQRVNKNCNNAMRLALCG